MKKTQFKQILPAIQVLSIAAILTILASSLVSFTIRSFSDDFLKQLGLTKPGAEEKIRHGFLSGSFDAYGVKNLKNIVLVLDTFNPHAMPELRRLFVTLAEHQITIPVILKRNYLDLTEEAFQLGASTEIGALLLDGLGEGIWLKQINCTSPKNTNSTAFGNICH